MANLSPQERWKIIHTQTTPTETTRAWGLFRGYYLDNIRKRGVPSPPLHYAMIQSCATYARNMIAAPRSFAKSTVVGFEWPLFLALTRPGTDILIVVGTHQIAKKRGEQFMWMISHNSRIVADFGDQKGSNKNQGRQWNYGRVGLANGSVITISSLGSQHLGSRPDVIILDDVEPDPQKVANWETVVEELTEAIFNVFLPMLDAGTSMVMIGTLLHRKSFLYWAMHTNDPRLKFWNRMLIAIRDQFGTPTWPEKFDEKTIEMLIQELGYAAFSAQYLNAPVSSENATLQFHDRRNIFEVEGVNNVYHTDPLQATAVLRTYTTTDGKGIDADINNPLWVPVDRDYASTVAKMFRFVVVDYARGESERADFSCILVLGLDSTDTLYVLDGYIGKESIEKLTNRIWHYAYKWKTRVVAVENIGAYQALCEKVVSTRGDMEKVHGWVPRVQQVKYPAHLNKELRISSMGWRFTDGKIKIPLHLGGAMTELHRQITGFTEDGRSLDHDDAVDTLAMWAQVVKVRPRGDKTDEARLTLAQRLARGEKVDPVTGLHYASGVSSRDLPERIEKPQDKKEVKPPAFVLPLEYTMLDVARLIGAKKHG